MMAYLFVIGLVLIAMAFLAIKVVAEVMADIINKIITKMKEPEGGVVEETEPL